MFQSKKKVSFVNLMLLKLTVQETGGHEVMFNFIFLVHLHFPPTHHLNPKKTPLTQNEAVCHKPVPAGCCHGFHSGRNGGGGVVVVVVWWGVSRDDDFEVM